MDIRVAADAAEVATGADRVAHAPRRRAAAAGASASLAVSGGTHTGGDARRAGATATCRGTTSPCSRSTSASRPTVTPTATPRCSTRSPCPARRAADAGHRRRPALPRPAGTRATLPDAARRRAPRHRRRRPHRVVAARRSGGRRTDPVAMCGAFNGPIRMTLTPPRGQRGATRLVLVAGASKAAPLVRRWLHGDDRRCRSPGCAEPTPGRRRRSGAAAAPDRRLGRVGRDGHHHHPAWAALLDTPRPPHLRSCSPPTRAAPTRYLTRRRPAHRLVEAPRRRSTWSTRCSPSPRRPASRHGATRCSPASRSTPPSSAPCCTPRCARRAARERRRRRPRRRARRARGARPDGRVRRSGARRRVARRHRRADPHRRQHRHRRQRPRPGDGVPGHATRSGSPTCRAASSATSTAPTSPATSPTSIRPRRCSSSARRRSPPSRRSPTPPRRARWLTAALGDDAVAKHFVAVSTNAERGRRVRHRHREHVRLLGLGRRPLLGRLGDRPVADDRHRPERLPRVPRRLPHDRRALPHGAARGATRRCCWRCSASGTQRARRAEQGRAAVRARAAPVPRVPAAARHGEQRQARAPRRVAGHHRHRADRVGRAGHQRPARVLPTAAPGHPAGADRLHRLRPAEPRAASTSTTC